MKALLRSIPVAIGVALVTPPCLAANITVEVTARVSSIYDPGNVLGGQIRIGQEGSGRYSYDTSVPDSLQYSSWQASYPQSASQLSATFTLVPFTVESDAGSPYWWASVDVYDYQPNMGASDYVRVISGPPKPLPGIDSSQLMFQFADYNGSVLSSDALPATAPNLQSFPWSQGYFSGSRGSDYFEIRADMVTVALVGAAAGTPLIVSPPAGTFVSGQAIVPALLLPAGAAVIGVEGSINNLEMPWFFSSCYRPSLGSQQYIAFICPDARYNLMPGTNRVDLRVRLGDGSLVSKTVEWEVIQ
jgi:hypothetical protein